MTSPVRGLFGEGTVVSGHNERTPILAAVVDQGATTRTDVTIQYNEYLGDTISTSCISALWGGIDIDIADA